MLSAEEQYVEFHRDRYQLLIATIAASMHRIGRAGAEILVAGPSHETALIAARFPSSRVDTLGLFDPRFPAPGGRHHEFDLNLCRERRPDLGPYDIVILAEVIEHLQTSPRAVLGFFRELLRPGGELIVQTPNAASLAKRWNLLVGRNPFMPIPDNPDSSQHWREYTPRELAGFAAEAGLAVAGLRIDNCYRHLGSRARLYLMAGRLAPDSLRDCITLTLQAPPASAPPLAAN